MEQKRKDNGWEVEYVFADTGAEHPKTYEFIKKCVDYFDINLTCLRAVYSDKKGVGVTYKKLPLNQIGWDLSIMERQIKIYGNFTINRTNCTSRMKADVMDKYKKDVFGKGKYFQWFGMRIDEPRRLKNLETTKDMFGKKAINPDNTKYLAEISDFEKQDILNWWAEMPFDLEINEHLGNCVFCIKKGGKKIALAQREEPELFKQWDDIMTGESVRLMPSDKFGIGRIYRGWLTPNDLIAKFSDLSTEELYESIYRGKGADSGSCSESCEGNLGQTDMFKEVSQ
jgi:hypothetical protein